MVSSGVLTPEEAFKSLSGSTLLVLTGLMIIMGKVDEKGFVEWVSKILLLNRPSAIMLLVRVSVLSSVVASLIMNDGAAMFGSGVIMSICDHLELPLEPYAIALATSANIGSAATVLGNPKNLVVSENSGLSFLQFARVMVPAAFCGTVLNTMFLVAFYGWQLKGLGTTEKRADDDEEEEEESDTTEVEKGEEREIRKRLLKHRDEHSVSDSEESSSVLSETSANTPSMGNKLNLFHRTGFMSRLHDDLSSSDSSYSEEQQRPVIVDIDTPHVSLADVSVVPATMTATLIAPGALVRRSSWPMVRKDLIEPHVPLKIKKMSLGELVKNLQSRQTSLQEFREQVSSQMYDHQHHLPLSDVDDSYSRLFESRYEDIGSEGVESDETSYLLGGNQEPRERLNLLGKVQQIQRGEQQPPVPRGIQRLFVCVRIHLLTRMLTWKKIKRNATLFMFIVVLVLMYTGFLYRFHLGFTCMTAALVLLLIDRTDPSNIITESVHWQLLCYLFGIFIVLEGVKKTPLTDSLWSIFVPWFVEDNYWISAFVFSFVSFLVSVIFTSIPSVMLIAPHISSIPNTRMESVGWYLLAWNVTLTGNLTPWGSVAGLIVTEVCRCESTEIGRRRWVGRLGVWVRYTVVTTIVILICGVVVVSWMVPKPA